MIDQIRPFAGFDYIQNSNPTIDVNPNALGKTWLNISTGEIFVCTDATTGANTWVGQFGNKISSVYIDPYIDNVIILLAFNDAIGSKVFPYDYSNNHYTGTGIGIPISVDASSPYGRCMTSCSNNYYELTDYNLYANDYTIEAWVKGPFTSECVIAVKRLLSDSTSYGITIGPNYFRFKKASSETFQCDVPEGFNDWTHIALSRTSDFLRMFTNGIQKNEYPQTTSYSNGLHWFIGADANLNLDFSGSMYDFRITGGVGRYTNNFIPESHFVYL